MLSHEAKPWVEEGYQGPVLLYQANAVPKYQARRASDVPLNCRVACTQSNWKQKWAPGCRKMTVWFELDQGAVKCFVSLGLHPVFLMHLSFLWL